LQKEKALDFVRNAKINILNNGCSIMELKHLKKYLARIFSFNDGLVTVI